MIKLSFKKKKKGLYIYIYLLKIIYSYQARTSEKVFKKKESKKILRNRGEIGSIQCQIQCLIGATERKNFTLINK